jgi:hypothetical protein
VKRSACFGLIAAIAMSAAATAYAWEPVAGTHARAPRWSGPLIYRVNERGSDDIDIDALLPEVDAAMNEWTTPDCTGARTRYDGLTAEVSADNVIAWHESAWMDGPESVAVTATSFVENGSGAPEIVAATMRLNGQHWKWVTGASAYEQRIINAFSVILHEGGHYWGLGHTPVAMSVMNVEYSKDLTGLAPDDIEGICSLYPKGQVDPAPDDCDAGPCTDDPGSCVVDRDCASDDQRCVGGRCMSFSDPPAAMCLRDGECEASERCKAGVCVEHEPTEPAGLPVGSACDMDDDCASGLCRLDGAVSRCTAFCEADEDCGSRGYCMRDGAQAGLCGELEPAATERDADSGGCSTAASSAPTIFTWLLVPFMLHRVRRWRAPRS